MTSSLTETHKTYFLCFLSPRGKTSCERKTFAFFPPLPKALPRAASYPSHPRQFLSVTFPRLIRNHKPSLALEARTSKMGFPK